MTNGSEHLPERQTSTVTTDEAAALATITEVAEAIARWDYVTATKEEPDSDESLILPPHMEIAARVTAIVRSRDAEAERRIRDTSAYDWGIEISRPDCNAAVVYVERDRAACERFIASPSLWHTPTPGESMRVVKRLSAGAWTGADER